VPGIASRSVSSMPGMIVAEFRQEAHEAKRADRAHDPEIERRIVEAEELFRLRLSWRSPTR